MGCLFVQSYNFYQVRTSASCSDIFHFECIGLYKWTCCLILTEWKEESRQLAICVIRAKRKPDGGRDKTLVCSVPVRSPQLPRATVSGGYVREMLICPNQWFVGVEGGPCWSTHVRWTAGGCPTWRILIWHEQLFKGLCRIKICKKTCTGLHRVWDQCIQISFDTATNAVVMH